MKSKISNTAVCMLGVLAVAAAAFSWIFASVCDTSWVFGTNCPCELGVSDNETAKYLFTYGFYLLGGVLTALFGLAFAMKKNSTAGSQVFGILTMLAGILLVVLCFFNYNDKMHEPIAAAMSVFLVFAIASMTVQDWYDRKYLFGAIGIGALGVSLLYFMIGPENMMETAFAVAVIIYGMVQCIKLEVSP
jgi:hypothetical membrane protein